MLSNTNKLNLKHIDDYLAKLKISHQILLFQELDSTNSHILEHIAKFKDNDVVITEMQTLGRGRFSNKWFSEPFIGLTFSLLKFFDKNIKLDTLPLVISIAVKRLLNEFNIPAKIKWPNDILHPDGSKIAGILLEGGLINNQYYVVIGIGINDNFKIERNLFLVNLLKHIDETIEIFINNNFDIFKEEWLDSCIHYNKSVGIYQNGNLVESGVNIGLSESGAILIKTNNSAVKEFTSASIRFEI